MRPTFGNSTETNQEILTRLGGSFKVGFLITVEEIDGVMKESHHRSVCEFELIDLTQDDDDWTTTPTPEKAAAEFLIPYQTPITKYEDNVPLNSEVEDPYRDPQPSTSSGIVHLRDPEVTRPLPIGQLLAGADHNSNTPLPDWRKLVGAPLIRTGQAKTNPWVKGHTPPRQTQNEWTMFRWKLQTRERQRLKRLKQRDAPHN